MSAPAACFENIDADILTAIYNARLLSGNRTA
jgi:hypothetical protein